MLGRSLFHLSRQAISKSSTRCLTTPSTVNRMPTGIHHINSLRHHAMSKLRPRSTTTPNLVLKNTSRSHQTAYTEHLTNYRHLSTWIFGCSGMVFGMVVVGGSTRLTRSGLSMTDWSITGSRLPMNEETWSIEFQKYKDFPEYKRLNMSMTLEEFKSIYWWEWAHRMWGRAIGVVFVLPWLYFVAKRNVPKEFRNRFMLLLGMGGMQGLVGWWMVKSGLEHEHIFGIERSEHDTPRVSPYRLATHLSMAFATYGLLTFTGMDLYRKSILPKIANGIESQQGHTTSTSVLRALKRLRGVSIFMSGVVGVTVLSGAFVAGNDAGRAYNDWPLMAGEWIPLEIWDETLGLRNFFENTATVQFDHRMLATATVASVGTVLFLASRKGVWQILPPEAKAAVLTMAGVTVGQFTLGVTTLINYVPVYLGVAHQAGALTTWTAAVVLLNMLKHVK